MPCLLGEVGATEVGILWSLIYIDIVGIVSTGQTQSNHRIYIIIFIKKQLISGQYIMY